MTAPAGPERASPFQVIEQRRIHDGFVKLDLYRVRQALFAGGWTPPLVREVVVANKAVAVICYDPEQEAVALVEQARLPAELAGFPAIQTEVVAGLADPEETPEAVATREVREETGLEVEGALLPIAHIITTPGHSTETVHVFCARVRMSDVEGSFGLADEHEDIRVVHLPLPEFAARLKDGRIANSFTLVAGFWLMANRAEVRRAWGLESD